MVRAQVRAPGHVLPQCPLRCQSPLDTRPDNISLNIIPQHICDSDISDIMFSSPPHPALRLGPGLPPTPFPDPSFLSSHAAQQRQLAGNNNF